MTLYEPVASCIDVVCFEKSLPLASYHQINKPGYIQLFNEKRKGAVVYS